MKKLLVGAFLGMFAVAGVAVLPNYASASDGSSWANPQADTNLVWDGNQKLEWSALLDTVKNAINWILWILATVALVICLYGWFKMITSGGDEKKYEEWLKVLKNAAIWLAIVGLSWIIVSVIFWFVGTLSGDKQTKWTSVSGTDSKGAITSTVNE